MLLLLLACGSAPESAPSPAPSPAVQAPSAAATPAPSADVPDVAWEGTWVRDANILSISNTSDMLHVQFMIDGDIVHEGIVEGGGAKRSAALDGCGADLNLPEVGGDMKVALDGPECAANLDGEWINTVSP